MIQKLGRDPTSQEIAKEMSLPNEQITYIMQMIQPPCSLEITIGTKDGNSLKDVLEDTTALQPIETVSLKRRKEKINLLLSVLTEQERSIIHLRFGLEGEEPQTLEMIGKKFDLTLERIRQIEASALKKSRCFLIFQQIYLSDLL
jgi:RNA polymerase primary sigma factor